MVDISSLYPIILRCRRRCCHHGQHHHGGRGGEGEGLVCMMDCMLNAVCFHGTFWSALGVLELGLWRTWAARWHSVISSMPFSVYVHNLERILWRSVYIINSLPFVCGFFYICLSFIYSNWASSSFGGCWHVVFIKKRLKCYHLLILKVLSRVLDLYFQINADSGAVQESCRGD